MAGSHGRKGIHQGRHRVARGRVLRLGGVALKVLLDTHIWLWSLLRPDLLSRRVKEVIEDPSTEIWLSPISVWELLVLVEKGRVELGSDTGAWLSEALERVPLKDASLNFAIAEESRRLALSHDDPADRFIAATAKVLELTLVTADRRLIASADIRVLANS